MAWASSQTVAADDWVVIAQQSDEAARDFRQRVCQRAQRLRKEDTQLESIDVYAGPDGDLLSAEARRAVVEELAVELASGGRLTLWSGSNDARGDAELSALLAQFGPILTQRQIAVNHQTWEANERSGVRHARPLSQREAESSDSDVASSLIPW